MAVGLVGGEASQVENEFGIGEVWTEQRRANLIATVNALYALVHTQSYYRVLPALETVATHWAVNDDVSLVASNAAEAMRVPLILDGISASSYQRLTEVTIYIKPGGAAPVELQLVRSTDLSSGVPTVATIGEASSSGTDYQALTLTGLDVGPDHRRYLCLVIVAGQGGDLYYGSRMRFDNSLYL